MSKTATLKVKNKDILETLQGFFKSILETDDVDAVLVPMHRPGEKAVMPVLISNPEYMDKADPIAPSFPINAAKLVSRLTRKPSGGKMVVVLRSCEITGPFCPTGYVPIVAKTIHAISTSQKLQQGRISLRT